MGMFHGRHRPSIASLFTAMLVLLFASATHSFSSTRKLGNGMRNERQYARGSTTTAVAILENIMMSRRRLSGPGSSPPSCRSKCGRCAPCSPVHVPVHPGLTIPLEYYPEAWRCKCGNKLYMP